MSIGRVEVIYRSPTLLSAKRVEGEILPIPNPLKKAICMVNAHQVAVQGLEGGKNPVLPRLFSFHRCG
jgi:hypothetical protein